jgi:hypothetical protein
MGCLFGQANTPTSKRQLNFLRVFSNTTNTFCKKQLALLIKRLRHNLYFKPNYQAQHLASAADTAVN